MHTEPILETTPSRRDAFRISASTALGLAVSGMTDRGRVRSSNEDRFLIAPLSDGAARGHLFAVADGVGGANGGEEAASLAVETIEQICVPALSCLLGERALRYARVFDELRAGFRAADARLTEEAARTPALRGMGTTLTAAASLGRALFVAHAGDSRCYLLRGGAFRPLTNDHTVAAQLARMGLVEPANLAHHPFRSVLSNWIGIGGALEIEVHVVELVHGDVVLLCSDGLTGMMPSPTLAGILRTARTPAKACRELVARANDLGGEDNVTAVVAHCGFAD